MAETSQQVHDSLHLDSIKFIPENRVNYEHAFLTTMHRLDVGFAGPIIADGKIHRFSIGRKGRKDGWYVFFGMAGAFGDWKRGIHEKWSVKNESLSHADKKYLQHQLENEIKATEKAMGRRYEKIASFALRKWNTFSERGDSPYLIKKKVNAFGIRHCEHFLVIPMKDGTGKLWSLQFISQAGAKWFLRSGRKKGCFHHIGEFENGKPIFVTEGYATAASVYMAVQQTTVTAFDAGNLEPVIDELKKIYPESLFIIAGDDDRWSERNIGRTKAEDVARKHNCSVVFPTFKNTELMPTDFNDLHVNEGLEEVKAQIEQATQSLEWTDPKPIDVFKNDLSPVIALPRELIPEPYQAWLIDITERMQCPLDYVAIGSLIVTASLIGAGCGIRPKSVDSWTVIPNLWGGIIGAPSTLKSPALKEILSPLEILEREAFEFYEKDQKTYLIEYEAYKATRDIIKKELTKAACNSDNLALNAAKEKLKNLQEPQTPSCKRYSTNDTTIEKMHELLSKNSRGLLLHRDELMGLLTTWEKVGHESDRAFYLEAWNGYGSKTTDRIGRGTIHTKYLCVSILGSTQPSKLLSYFQRASAATENDGLLQRFQLLVYPDHPKEWRLVDQRPDDKAKTEAFAVMSKLANMDFCNYGAQIDENSEIPYFHFDNQAQGIFYEWLTALENELRNRSEESIITEHLAKYRKLMPALALIFHLINIANGNISGPVTKDCVERAIGWCEYLEAHAHRIYTSGLSQIYQGARNLAQKIQEGKLKDPFDRREIYRKQWSSLKTKEEVEAACELLIEHYWLREETLSEGRKTKTCFFINPKILIRDQL